jgi:hypothetical protein
MGWLRGRAGAEPPAFWAQDRAQVFEILSAYVRTNSHRPPASWPPGFDWRAAGARLVRAC